MGFKVWGALRDSPWGDPQKNQVTSAEEAEARPYSQALNLDSIES